MTIPDFLRDPAWQGIGVILALVVVILPTGWRILWKRKREAEEGRQLERKEIHDLIRVLENRRVLNPRSRAEPPPTVVNSVRSIRRELMNTIKKLNEESDVSQSLYAMQEACRRFLDKSRAN